MKLHFEDNLDYQITAIQSVVDLFKGQEISSSEFSVSYGDKIVSQNSLDLPENQLGIGNHLQLLDKEIHENLNCIQCKNGLKPSASLVHNTKHIVPFLKEM